MRESVSQMIREKLNKNKWGIEGYNLPDYNPQHKQHIGMKKWAKDKIPTMYDIIKKKAQSTPSPDKYSSHEKLQVPRFYSGFSKVKRYLLKYHFYRVTYIDEIVKNKKKIPGPSSYKPNPPKSRKSFFSSKAYSGNSFIDEAIFRGKETPGIQKVKYVR